MFEKVALQFIIIIIDAESNVVVKVLRKGFSSCVPTQHCLVKSV